MASPSAVGKPVHDGTSIDVLDNIVPVFDERDCPLPTVDIVRQAGWPKNKEILARGAYWRCHLVLGADLADEQMASRASLTGREYHHFLPNTVVTDVGHLDDRESFRALNCALISWRTNRTIAAKDPSRISNSGSRGHPSLSRRSDCG